MLIICNNCSQLQTVVRGSWDPPTRRQRWRHWSRSGSLWPWHCGWLWLDWQSPADHL